MKLATITGQDGKRITIGTGNNGRAGRILVASNGEEVHPDSRPYRCSAYGTAQALHDIECMWGKGCWNLEWLDNAIDFEPPVSFEPGMGYKD